MSKPAITSMIMYDDIGLELDVFDVVLAIYSIYTAYQLISLSLMPPGVVEVVAAT
jgi:hypothetical protein